VTPPDTPVIAHGPWNPGISSRIPEELRRHCTIFRPENTFTSVDRADELHDLTGLDFIEVVAFKPQRLALHELLIRVTADLSVPDGIKIEDLGINFRQMTRTILARYIEPRESEIATLYATARSQVAALIEREMAALYSPQAIGDGVLLPKARRGLFAFFARTPVATAAPAGPDAEREGRLVSQWEQRSNTEADPVQRAAYRAMAKVVSALLVRHGNAWGGQSLIASLATDIACNQCASDEIGNLVGACLKVAAEREGFTLLPRQDQPVVMNTKGASASGKSTLRPLQKRLAGDIGVRWSEFALISPDIWRKQLIDYATLGPIYKYGGAFSGDELRIVDQKLDRYMARKAESGGMTHLLIDRFRFDSFAPDSEEAGSNLLTRFGNIVYLFFMITPPDSLVERAWARGLDVGRYKAVDDTLAHSVEAYSGMPQVFFTWAQRTDKRVHFEFLDNSVRQGDTPRTVAFGWNDELNVLDVKCLLDVERYRRINVDATSPDALYPVSPNTDDARFLRNCIAKFRQINFADHTTGRVYLRVRSGAAAWIDKAGLDDALTSPETRAGLSATLPALFKPNAIANGHDAYLAEIASADHPHTLGAWGSAIHNR
jgi:hypothetical protein